MIVHFVAPTPYKRLQIYKKIAEDLVSGGHTLTREFKIDIPTKTEMGLGLLDQEDWETLCQRELSLLEGSDAVIVDATNKSTFGVGYQAAIALTLSKPILLLLHKESIQGSFINGLVHPLLVRSAFDENNAGEVVVEFISRLELKK